MLKWCNIFNRNQRSICGFIINCFGYRALHTYRNIYRFSVFVVFLLCDLIRDLRPSRPDFYSSDSWAKETRKTQFRCWFHLEALSPENTCSQKILFPDVRKLLHKKAEWIWKFLRIQIIRKKLIFERLVKHTKVFKDKRSLVSVNRYDL